MKRKRTIDQQVKELEEFLDRNLADEERTEFERDSLREEKFKRERGLRAEAEKNKREAGRDREYYLDIARQLREQDPSLRRATPNRLANKVREEIIERRKKA